MPRRILLLTLVALMWPASADAFAIGNILRREWNRGVDVSGTYTVTGSERLTNVHLMMYNSAGAFVGSSQGTFNSVTKRWSVSGGHYALKQYRVQFTYVNSQGRSVVVYSPVYIWTLNGLM